MDISLFDKYKDIKVESCGLLFEPDWYLAKEKICPYCHRRLYEMRSRPFWYCRNKTHKRFLINKDKIK